MSVCAICYVPWYEGHASVHSATSTLDDGIRQVHITGPAREWARTMVAERDTARAIAVRLEGELAEAERVRQVRWDALRAEMYRQAVNDVTDAVVLRVEALPTDSSGVRVRLSSVILAIRNTP
jgi:hypothetical protein